jgi:hypothetical protein
MLADAGIHQTGTNLCRKAIKCARRSTRDCDWPANFKVLYKLSQLESKSFRAILSKAAKCRSVTPAHLLSMKKTITPVVAKIPLALALLASVIVIGARPSELTKEQYTQISQLRPNESVLAKTIFSEEWDEICLESSIGKLQAQGYTSFVTHLSYAIKDEPLQFAWFVLKNQNKSKVVGVDRRSTLVFSATEIAHLPLDISNVVPALSCADRAVAKIRANKTEKTFFYTLDK